MIYAVEWLSLHIFGVFVTIALLLIVSQKEDTNYKSELLLTIGCCLVTLVAKSIYIIGGSEETLLAIGKLEYLGKCFANFCVLLFILRWRNVRIPQWFIYSLLTINIGFYIIIATIDHHHLYYKSYWLAPSKVNLSGYTLEISAAPIYYIYMAFGFGDFCFHRNYHLLLSFEKENAIQTEAACNPDYCSFGTNDTSFAAYSRYFKRR